MSEEERVKGQVTQYVDRRNHGRIYRG